jgi:glutamine synthetase
MIVKLEYVWLDGGMPDASLRSKTKVIDINDVSKIDNSGNLPIWSYDGSSTGQAEGSKSDCLLKPVRVIRDPQRKNAFLVMCEVLNPDGSAHETNTRSLVSAIDDEDSWYGFEQEYTLMDNNGRPLGGFLVWV